eukprot:371279-Prymnesium_polylepis.1
MGHRGGRGGANMGRMECRQHSDEEHSQTACVAGALRLYRSMIARRYTAVPGHAPAGPGVRSQRCDAG